LFNSLKLEISYFQKIPSFLFSPTVKDGSIARVMRLCQHF